MDSIFALFLLPGEQGTRGGTELLDMDRGSGFLETLNEIQDRQLREEREEVRARPEPSASREDSPEGRRIQENEDEASRRTRETERKAAEPEKEEEPEAAPLPAAKSEEREVPSPSQDVSQDAPRFEEQILSRLKAQLNPLLQEGKAEPLLLDIGKIQLQLQPEGEHYLAKLASSEGIVRQALENHLPQVKEALSSAGFKVSQIMVLPQDNLSPGGDFSQHMPRSDLSGSQVSRTQNFIDLARFGADLSRAEAEISRQYGIRNLHQHVLDQIRIRMDGARNEARIRLHPPELGEIKIHMVMEDSRLTVRMEVAEQMVRHLLERDLDALKHVLSEAGIDVDGFDIEYREKPYSRNQTAGSRGAFPSEAGDSHENDGEEGFDGGDPQGAIRLSVRTGGVDYLVY